MDQGAGVTVYWGLAEGGTAPGDQPGKDITLAQNSATYEVNEVGK